MNVRRRIRLGLEALDDLDVLDYIGHCIARLVNQQRRLIIADGRLIWDRRREIRYHWINERRQANRAFLDYLVRSGHGMTILATGSIPMVLFLAKILYDDPLTRLGVLFVHTAIVTLYLLVAAIVGSLRRAMRTA